MKYWKNYQVRTYDTNMNGDLKFSRLFDYLIDISTEHSEKSVDESGFEIDFFWIIYEWDIRVNKIPKHRDELKINTYSVGLDRFYAYRNWEIYRGEELLISAKTKWMGLSKEDGKLVRLPKELEELYGTEDGEKIGRSLKIPKLDFNKERSFDVRYADIDVNNHVNNARYVDWVREVYNGSIKRFRIVYKQQTFLGESIDVNAVDNGDEFYFTITGEDGTLRAEGVIEK